MSSFGSDKQPPWPVGDSEMAVLIRCYDWSASSLGRIEDWSQSLRTLIDICLAHPLPCAVVCGPDRLLLYNNLCAQLQGDAHPRALGMPAASSFPEALSDVGPIHERLLAGEAMILRKRPWVFQRQGMLTTGHYDVVFTPVRDESGAYVHALATILDVEAASVAVPGQAVAVAGPPLDALWILDVARMRLEYASPTLDRLLGEGRAMVQADFRRWLDLIHPDDLAAVEKHLAHSAVGEALVAQYRIIRASDGDVREVRHTSFPMQGRDGAPGRVAGLVQDVTAIQRATAALLAEKERNRTLVEGIQPLVWRSCDDGLWTWAGPQWLSFTGQTQEQTWGWGWLDVVHPDDRDATMQAWHQARPHGLLDATFRLWRASDKSWRWHQTRSLPRRVQAKPGEPEGKIIEWLGSSTDIDDLKRLQAQQDAMIAQLEHRAASLKGVIRSLGGVVEAENVAVDP